MNDKDREDWIMNDEPLYRWWKSSRVSVREFIRLNRVELTKFIEQKLGLRIP